MAAPMTHTQWIEALEAEGVKQQGYGSWTTHGRDSATGRVFGPAYGVVIHHTAGTSSLALCYNGTSTLPGPLCHTHLAKNAVASMLSVRRANHAGTFAQNAHDAVLNEDSFHPYPDAAEPVDGNDHYYGLEIENLGNGTDPYPWVQYVAAVKWATAICRFHGWTQDSVIGHKEGTRRKIDPKGPVVNKSGVGTFDFTMNRFRADVRDALALLPGRWQGVQEEEEVTPEDIAAVAAKVKQELLGDADLLAYLLKRDNVLKNPNPESNVDNPYIAVGTALNNTEIVARRTEDKIDALAVGGVDLDALAVKVADELYRRMAE